MMTVQYRYVRDKIFLGSWYQKNKVALSVADPGSEPFLTP
jgi:hypothetical protein